MTGAVAWLKARVGDLLWPPVVPGTLGAHPAQDGTWFAVRAPDARQVTLCLFDYDEERRVAMIRVGEQWQAKVGGVGPGQRYGYRTDADPAKLLVDPYALKLDRRYVYHPALGQPGVDTAAIVPKAIVPTPWIDGPPPPRSSRPAASSTNSMSAASRCAIPTCLRKHAAPSPRWPTPRSSRTSVSSASPRSS